MSNSDAVNLEALKLARDTVLADIASGASYVSYEIGNRKFEREPPSKVLKELDALIALYTSRTVVKNRAVRFSGISSRGL